MPATRRTASTTSCEVIPPGLSIKRKPFMTLTKPSNPFRIKRPMNVTELARRLRITPNELLTKLPALGFDIGGRAIKVDDRVADQIYKKWLENARRERLRDQLVRSSTVDPSGAPVVKTEVALPSVLSVRDFAGKLGLPVTRVIQQLMRAGILASQNERIDFTTAAIIAEELGFKANPESVLASEQAGEEESTNRIKSLLEQEKTEDLVPRAPVVVVMGHVDHGKTRTLDAIRQTHVMEKESGGITQHIGAYQTEKNGKKITFIDTPGHEAFTVMRSRGAKVADIAILVVAADDGVQPQTKEAVQIIQAAKLPFVVALNKIDKPEADPNRVMGQLAEIGVTVEEWGGKTPMTKISAKTGQGIPELLDLILLVAEVEKDHIMANPERKAAGTIVESHVDKGEGPVATVLVQTGTLHRNDCLGIAGAAYGRVRAMRDWTGAMVDEAGPGMPVKILGFKVAPAVGDILEVPEDPKMLEQKKAKTSRQVAEAFTATKAVPTEEETANKKITLNIVLKTDVLGSLEALLGMLEKIKHELVGTDVIQKGLGNVTESDIERAANAKPSVVYGFNVMTPAAIESDARDKGVEIKSYKIIYELFDDVVARLNRLLPQELIVTALGEAEIAAVFRTDPGKMILGAKVKTGKLLAGAKVRVWRGQEPVGEGILESLQSGKSVVKEVSAGQECGLSFKGKTKIAIGDRFEVYMEESKTRKVETFR
ncbi:translation initiation factor IF-2 [Candidatus Uhrbacteria bacterium]|nr:translation initiation factor IF-2 [Candidatus Uhrbacteria bacterium]